MSVYFIKVGRYLKVGYSSDPERRCKNLWRSTTRYSRPWDLSLNEPRELLLAIEGDKTTEHWVHDALDDFRSNGEWFIDEPEVRVFMAWAAAGEFSGNNFGKVARPAGPFERVNHEHMLPERRAEIDRTVEATRKRKVRKQSAALGLGINVGGAAGYRYSQADVDALWDSMRPVQTVARKRKRRSA